MFERYTESARRALFFARYEVTELGGLTIEPEHLLLGVLREAPQTIERSAPHTSVESLRRRLTDAQAPREKVSTSVEIPFSRESKAAIERAALEADDVKTGWIGPGHLVLGILVTTSGEAMRALEEAGVRAEAIREYLRTTPEDSTVRTADISARLVNGAVLRQWKGVVKPGLAVAYVRHLQHETLPALARLLGFVHATIAHREVEDGTEFQVTTVWRALDDIKAFAGDDVTAAVVPPAARAMMVRYDDRAVHYVIVS